MSRMAALRLVMGTGVTAAEWSAAADMAAKMATAEGLSHAERRIARMLLLLAIAAEAAAACEDSGVASLSEEQD